MTTYYKFLNPGGEPAHGGNGRWFLPTSGKPGKWMPKIEGEIEPCRNGYHLCREQDLLNWTAPELYIAERKGELVKDDNKVVARQARLVSRVDNWNERTQRLFACDCADRAMALIARHETVDPRSINAVKVARLYAIGEATNEELAAAWDAAWDAARAAAWDAAWDAARDAARDAAWDAAWDAARDAARDAAWAAAWDAARAAALDAAWDAALDAEREWQIKRILEYLNGEV